MKLVIGLYKIFIVEDDPGIAGAIKKEAAGWGFSAETVNDFSNVAGEFSAFSPHLVLLDISLPFYNGYYWCEKIRAVSSVPIIFISSAADNMNMVMAMNMGADDFIAKPFDMNVLIAKINALLRRAYDFAPASPVLEHRGALILAGAYIIAVTITNPMAAIFMYFVAVIMVIVATYMLFISGSVALCKALQKNKHYYYKTNHFISVSTMAYRMKRNGAGLASICILSTMVLVMISCTVCLYTGMDDSLRTRYPRDLVIDITAAQDGSIDESIINSANETFDGTVKKSGVNPLNRISYRLSDFSANVSGSDFQIVTNGFYNSSAYNVLIVPLEDYNRLMGKNETLGENEAIAYTTKLSDYDESTVNINGTSELTITKYVDDYIGYGIDISSVNDSIYLFVPNYDEYIARFADITEPNGNKVMSSHYIIGSDFDCETETLYDLTEAFDESIGANTTLTSASCGFSIESIAGSLEMFMGLYGGLFFLGILLGIVFIFAAVLIMYYKQISEGYEDRSRFDIMKKVGMTEKEIKKNINSQVLTVFFAPLVTAGVHLAFNFPLINRTITLLGFTNPTLLLGTTVACFLAFAVLYVIVYRITSSSYFNIVNAKVQ